MCCLAPPKKQLEESAVFSFVVSFSDAQYSRGNCCCGTLCGGSTLREHPRLWGHMKWGELEVITPTSLGVAPPLIREATLISQRVQVPVLVYAGHVTYGHIITLIDIG